MAETIEMNYRVRNGAPTKQEFLDLVKRVEDLEKKLAERKPGRPPKDPTDEKD